MSKKSDEKNEDILIGDDLPVGADFDVSKYVHATVAGHTGSGMSSSLVSWLYMESVSKVNISSVKREAIRAYTFLLFNGLLNLVFVLSTLAALVLGFLSVFGSQHFIEPSIWLRAYVCIFLAKLIWSVAYTVVRQKLQKRFIKAGLNLGSNGAEQVSAITDILNQRTAQLNLERDAIMAKHGNDPEKAKKELVLLLMKYGGKSES